ncbi:MAG TPA: transcriptional repressor [Deltaproteobacteria bacterium]|jgi:Fur family peroxide stress response transcriptional regulator|nr:transcriptional repressor [Deltaproteobacteria bacterium]
MEDSPSRFDSMLSKLREKGYRITPQRLAILKILAESQGHPGAEDIHSLVRTDFPTTTIATVYKTLAVLKITGEVLELEFSGDYNRYDGKKPGPHPHLICIKCKRIVDPDFTSLAEMTEKLASQTGYKLIGHRLDFYGICPECQQKG